MSDTLLDKLTEVEKRYQELEVSLSGSEVVSNLKEYARLGKERSSLEEVVTCFRDWRKTGQEIESNKPLLEDNDPEVRELAREELASLREQHERLEMELRRLLLPKDPLDEKNVLLEIRAGTGGEEASLFAAALFRMYTRYAEIRGWRLEVMSSSGTGLGGFKEIISLIEGRGAYSRLKFEGGVHRVQRVPETESSGRIHTSTSTVAVLPVADEVEVKIDERDLRIDVYRSTGPGGQSVNTTDSAVRITHLPTGLVVAIQDEKSQIKNKAKALSVLKSRLWDIEEARRQEELSKERRSQVQTGDRSEKIRTYNFPQDRVTDHRIGLSRHNLQGVLNGELDEFIDNLITVDQANKLQHLFETEEAKV